MAKQVKKAEKREYLYGTFIGSKSRMTINADSNSSDVERFLKDNPEVEKRVTDLERIKAQRLLIEKGK